NDLGIALDLQGRHAEAQARYRAILARAPHDHAAWVNLALSLSMTGQAAQSVAMLRGPAERADASAKLREDFALALTLDGQEGEARHLLLADLPPDQAQEALAGYHDLGPPAP
ncbi:MAG: tetratricopeptide repeat protein, partial [Rhodospirillales bacterium]|nr:tetratricopeptide repeat protein [Rhodospirillales bacterium]